MATRGLTFEEASFSPACALRVVAATGLPWPPAASTLTWLPGLASRADALWPPVTSGGPPWPLQQRGQGFASQEIRCVACTGPAWPPVANNWSASLAEVRRPQQNSQQHNFVQTRNLERPMKRDAHLITVPARAIDVGYANTKFTCGHKVARGVPIIHADLFPSITATLSATAW